MHASLVLFFFVTCFHSDFHVSSHVTLHRAQMSQVQKKKLVSQERVQRPTVERAPAPQNLLETVEVVLVPTERVQQRTVEVPMSPLSFSQPEQTRNNLVPEIWAIWKEFRI